VVRPLARRKSRAINTAERKLGRSSSRRSRTGTPSFPPSLPTYQPLLTSLKIGVSTLLFTDVFSPSSKTAFFNRAVTLIRAHPQCVSLLGPGDKISAHGEQSWSRHARNRFLASEEDTDKWGTEHMRFRFYVEGPLGQGVVHCHLVKRPSQGEFEWSELSVDVKGQRRVEVVDGGKKGDGKVAPKIFGARWW